MSWTGVAGASITFNSLTIQRNNASTHPGDSLAEAEKRAKASREVAERKADPRPLTELSVPHPAMAGSPPDKSVSVLTSRAAGLLSPQRSASSPPPVGVLGVRGRVASYGAEVDVAGDGDDRRGDGEVVGGVQDPSPRAGRHVGAPGRRRRRRCPARSPNLSSSVAAVFSPMPGHAGQPVGGVAAQGGEVGVLARRARRTSRTTTVVGDPLVVADAAGDVEDPHVARRRRRAGTGRGRR